MTDVPPAAAGRDGSSPAAPHVVVVGAGVAGAAAAHLLRREGPAGLVITVVDGAGRVGGKLRSADWPEIEVAAPLEEGAETFLARRPEAITLAGDCGLADDLVHPGVTDAAIWTRGRLRALPPGTVMGVPSDPVAMVRSGILSARSAARAALDLVLPPTARSGDLAVGALVGARMGREVVDRLVDPLLGGVYAGRADDLSLQATVPQLAARPDRTLLAAARAVRRAAAGADAGPVFATVRGGLDRLPAAALAASGAQLRLGTPATGIARTAGERLAVTVGRAGGRDVLIADAVVVATPAGPAARLLAQLAPDTAGPLARVTYASVVLLTLAYRGEPALPGSGFLVPSVDGRLIKAATFLTRKWPHLAAQAPGWTIVRCSVGRIGDTAVLQQDDRDLARAVGVELGLATGLPARPDAWRAARWGGALPQYPVGHQARMAAVQAAVARVPGLAVGGAAYDGVGIPACIGSGQRAARQVLAGLAARGPG